MLSKLHQVITKDGVPLDGLLFKPNRQSKAVAVWLGGLTSRFSSNPTRIHVLAKSLNKSGISFAVFDHRGFGNINKIKIQKSKRYLIGGTSFEKFEHCLFDIEAIIKFLQKNGFKKIYFLGHSTGANKVAYYIQKRNGKGLAGAALLGPMSDIPILKKELGRKYRQALAISEKMIRKGKGRELLPLPLVGGDFWSAERFWSLAREGSNEDTFPYYDPKRKFKWTKNVRIPVLVLIGDKDQFADRPVLKIIESFQKQIPQKYFTSAILKDADHGFKGKEKRLAQEIKNWLV